MDGPVRSLSTGFAEVAVDGGAGDAEFGDDLVDGVAAFAVFVEFVVHLTGQGDLAGAHLHIPTLVIRGADDSLI
jgi:hypothetical protein